MSLAKKIQKNVCCDCQKEIEITSDKKITNGFKLVYESEGGKIEVFKCKKCFKKDKSLKNYQACEVYSRVVGYLRPVQQWNLAKQEEYSQRKEYKI